MIVEREIPWGLRILQNERERLFEEESELQDWTHDLYEVM